MQAIGNTAGEFSTNAVASRKRKGGISPPTTVELRGVNIHFPFKPYKCQEDYMGKVLDALLRSENALLESPTGTGKTLCLLCATLAWQREQAKLLGDPTSRSQLQTLKSDPNDPLRNNTTNNKSVNRVPTIIYASRTHSQLSQVVRELRNTRYRPKHAVLGSREQMCVNPKVKKPNSNNFDINHDCNALAKERKCRFRNALDGFTAPSNDNTQPVLDMEDLVTMGKKHTVCPFYYTRSLVADAELILMPYNYLFDKDARETTLQDIVWNNAVVIFDEAHNLESFATESASFDLTSTDVALCIAELTRALNFINIMGDEDSHVVKRDNVAKLKALFMHFEDYLNTSLNAKGGSLCGEYMMEIFTKGMSINYGNHQLFISECKKVSELLLDARGGSSSNNKGAPKLEHFVQCVKRVFGESTEARCMAKAKSYRVHLTERGAQQHQQRGQSHGNKANGGASTGRTLSYWCFAPSLAMQELESLNLRSILVTSGTLSPLPSYSMELGIPFPHTLENPHIISPDQIHVRVIGTGVSGKELTSAYKRRQDEDYFMELGNTLVNLAKVIPAGMLVFFPSYNVMETCIQRWGGPSTSSSRFNNKNKQQNNFFAARNKKGKNSDNRQQYSFPYTAPSIYGSSLGANHNPNTPWKRLLGAKSIVVEPRSTTDLPDAISEFHKYLAMPKSKGVALFGICRGKISEGIDFCGDQSRAVIITGLPFAPAMDPKVKLKREYLDANKASKGVKSTEAGGFGASTAAAESGGGEGGNSRAAQLTSLSGQEWYNQQAHRSCNQAIGRVIRNKDDYGAVLLLESRYSQPINQKGLSGWVRCHLQKDEGFGVAMRSLASFYRKAAVQAKEREEARKGIVLEYEQEEEQEAKKTKQVKDTREDEMFTKVAFVQNLTRDLKQPKSAFETGSADSAQDNLDCDDPVSYIAPDRVIARMDVDAIRSKTEPVFENPKPTTNRALAKVESSSSAMPMRQTTMPSAQYQIPNNSFKKLDSKQAAAQFFKKAQKFLKPEEFSSIRKSIVAMKKHGDSKDEKSYLSAARDIVSLCCKREQFFGQHERSHGETMLFLLFQLLPALYRKEVQVMAMDELFSKSRLGGLCKGNLTQEQYSKVKGECSRLLQGTWCEDADSKLLQEAQKVLSLLQSDNRAVSTKLASAFLELIPSRFAAPCRALVTEMEASHKIQQMKTADARHKGEDSIDMIRFQRNQPPKSYTAKNAGPVKSEASISETNVASKTSKENNGGGRPTLLTSAKTTSNASHVVMSNVDARVVPKNARATSQESTAGSSAKEANTKAPANGQNNQSAPRRAPVNPYAKKPKLLSSLIGKQIGAVEPAAGATAAKAQLRQPPNRPAPQYSRTSQMLQKKPTTDPVANMLQQAESSPFVRKTSEDVVKALSRNAPDVCCAVCNKTASTPLLSDCHHLACQSCWLTWLKKSKTCMVCRGAVKPESLSRVVFQNNEYVESAPSALSQSGN